MLPVRAVEFVLITEFRMALMFVMDVVVLIVVVKVLRVIAKTGEILAMGSGTVEGTMV